MFAILAPLEAHIGLPSTRKSRAVLSYLGEELSPDGLNLELGGRDKGVKLVGLCVVVSAMLV